MDSIAERVGIKGHWTFRHLDPSGLVLAVHEYDNLITAGMDTLLASWLGAEYPVYGTPYIAVGTSTTPPAYADTQLGAEAARATIATYSRIVNATTLEALFGAGVATTHLYECGLFINGTATVNTGTLVNHAAIDENKAATTILLVTCTFTIT